MARPGTRPAERVRPEDGDWLQHAESVDPTAEQQVFDHDGERVLIPPRVRELCQLDGLAARFDLATPPGALRAFALWTLVATTTYPGVRWGLTAAFRREALRPVEQGPGGVRLPAYVSALYDVRHDFADRYPPGTAEGALGALGWFVMWEAPQLAWYVQPPWLDAYLQLPSPFCPDAERIGLSLAMHAAWAARGMAAAYDLSRWAGRLAFVGWFLRHGMSELPWYRVPEWQAAAWEAPSAFLEAADALGVPTALHALWVGSGDWRAAEDLATADGAVRAFARWGAVVSAVSQAPGRWSPSSAFRRHALRAVEQAPGGVRLPAYVTALYEVREGFARTYPPGTVEGALGALGWFVMWQAPELAWYAPPPWLGEYLQRPSPFCPDAERIGLSLAMHAAWAARGMAAAYDLTGWAGRLAFVGWFLRHGMSELPWYRVPDWQATAWEAPSAWLENAAALGVTVDLHALWAEQAGGDPGSGADGLALWRWYLVDGWHAVPRYRPAPWQAERLWAMPAAAGGLPLPLAVRALGEGDGLEALGRYLLQARGQEPPGLDPPPVWAERWGAPSPALDGARESGITLAMHAVWAVRDDWRAACDLARAEGRRRLLRRCEAAAFGDGRWFFEPRWLVVRLARGDDGAAPTPFRKALRQRYGLDGVQLVGWVKGELGVGEDVRTAARAADRAAIPHVLLDCARQLGARQEDLSLADRVVDAPRHFTNIVFLSAGDHYRCVAADPGIFRGRYTIGSWPWELPRWPGEMGFVYRTVDEIWAPSTFIRDAYRAAAGARPVTLVPLAVEVPAADTGADGRALLGAAPGDFVFFFAYDTFSSPYRKNPDAVVAAFRSAFPRGRGDVRLVIKTMHAAHRADHWRALAEAAGDDGRITLIDAVWPRKQTLAALAAADAVVSLHRSEGFGRVMAEAMLLGKPVIASAYSGNLDFTRPETAFLAEGVLRPVRPHEYHHSAGQSWFEPDIGHAAMLMRQCRDDEGLRATRACAGAAFVAEHHSPQRIGALYRSILLERGLVELSRLP
jgi:glycosyltransferase involved in cell wall biosynthesis